MVEYDGEQHFKPVRFGGISIERAAKRFKKQQRIDSLDFDFCEENNIILHRIKRARWRIDCYADTRRRYFCEGCRSEQVSEPEAN